MPVPRRLANKKYNKVLIVFDWIGWIEPWMFWSLGVILFALAAISAEVSVLPWIALSTFAVGIADYLGFSINLQLFVFSLSLLCFIFVSRRVLKSDLKGLDAGITEAVSDMAGKTVIIRSLDESSGRGIATGKTGREWNVLIEKGSSVSVGQSCRVKRIEGINLVVEGD